VHWAGKRSTSAGRQKTNDSKCNSQEFVDTTDGRHATLRGPC
jgi:hypothetical protein